MSLSTALLYGWKTTWAKSALFGVTGGPRSLRFPSRTCENNLLILWKRRAAERTHHMKGQWTEGRTTQISGNRGACETVIRIELCHNGHRVSGIGRLIKKEERYWLLCLVRGYFLFKRIWETEREREKARNSSRVEDKSVFDELQEHCSSPKRFSTWFLTRNRSLSSIELKNIPVIIAKDVNKRPRL